MGCVVIKCNIIRYKDEGNSEVIRVVIMYGFVIKYLLEIRRRNKLDIKVDSVVLKIIVI